MIWFSCRRFEVAVLVELQASQEADELLAIDVGAVVLGGQQIGAIHLTRRHLGEELLEQRIDAAGAEHQLHRRDRPVEEQGSGPGQQGLRADGLHQSRVHASVPESCEPRV
jgi:hypothetical protein